MFNFKRIVALALALLLFAGVVPYQALATEETTPVVEETVPVVEETAPVEEETVPAAEEETVPETEETIPEPVELPAAQEETAPVVEAVEPQEAEVSAEKTEETEEAVMMQGAVSQKSSVVSTGDEYILVPGEVEIVEPVAVEASVYDNASEYLSMADGAMQVRKNMKTRTTDFLVKVQFSWSGYSSKNEAIQNMGNYLYNKAVEHTGKPTEGDYLYKHTSNWDWYCNYTYYTNSYLIEATYDIDLKYMTSTYQEQVLDAKVKEILNELDLWAMNDYYKIRGVYDYITKNVVYDYAGLDNEYDLLKYSAYGALVENSCVCQGYANAFYRLMLELGVDARYVGGNDPDASHGWNIVKLGNVYYDVDSTWDSEWVQAGYSWRYFLICESIFSQDHVRRAMYTTTEFRNKYPMASSNYTGTPSTMGKTDLININGTYKYYKNGVFQSGYTGLVKNSAGNYYYVKNGKLDWGYTGLCLYGGVYYYVSGGKLNWNYTGLVQHSNGTWYYIQKGKLVWGYTGIVLHNKNYYYVSNSRINWNYTGLAKHSNGTWYYIQKGKLVWGYNGLVQYNNAWYYVQNSKINFSYTGLVQHSNGVWYYVQKGTINWNYTGLVKNSAGTWYYVEKGRINWNFSGVVKHNGSYYKVVNGRLK